MTRTPSAPADGITAVAGATLSFLNYGDAANWYYRVFVASAAEATPDKQGNTRYRAYSRAMSGGSFAEWTGGGSYARRNDQHWNGAAWVGCAPDMQMIQSARDANGHVANGNYCDSLELNSSTRTVVDISNRSMVEIVAAIRSSLPNYAGWGDPPAGFAGAAGLPLGSAVFPADSKLIAQVTTVTTAALAYDVTSPVMRYVPAVAAGGDARGNPGAACNNGALTNAPYASASLEDMMDGMKGQPCVFGQSSIASSASPTPVQSTNPNAWWSATSANIGAVGSVPLVAANPTSYYSGNTVYRVSFPGGNVTNYFACAQRQISGGSYNCTPAGSGTFAIATVGDARVMTLNNVPAAASALDYERIYVERAGVVYFGYKSKPASRPSTRLNLPAANALFQQLGIAAITP